MHNELPVVRVSRKGADRLLSGHPWVFASDVTDRGHAQPGEAVQVMDSRVKRLGTAHYSSTSQITLRLLSRGSVVNDHDFYRERIANALHARQRWVHDSDAYRLIHAEADGLPALIVDRYGEYLVVQTLNQGMDRDCTLIVGALEDLLRPKGIVLRNDVPVRTRESLPLESRVIGGDVPTPVSIRMNGLQLNADLIAGHKTGVFLDQRENYAAVTRYAHGRALDCFTATGGFALHMARACESVEAVDSSEPTLQVARQNALANAITHVEFRDADVFQLLTGYAQARRTFDTVVLDPPAFTKSRQAIEGAARGYKDINLRGLRILNSGGVLVSCSCSHHFSEAMLLETVAAAALDAGKTLRVLERRTQAQDHPILLTVSETMYLKCVIFEVV